MLVTLLLFLTAIIIMKTSKGYSNIMIIKEKVGPTNGFIQVKESPLEEMHELVFAIQQKNLDQIEQILNDVSNPSSANYGKHLTKQEVDELTVNHDGHRQVLEFLSLIGAEIVSSNDNYITTKAKIQTWNQSLNTVFHEYQHVKKATTVQRCVDYSLPEDIASQVSSVMNTVQFPVDIQIGRGPRIGRISLTKDPEIGV